MSSAGDVRCNTHMLLKLCLCVLKGSRGAGSRCQAPFTPCHIACQDHHCPPMSSAACTTDKWSALNSSIQSRMRLYLWLVCCVCTHTRYLYSSRLCSRLAFFLRKAHTQQLKKVSLLRQSGVTWFELPCVVAFLSLCACEAMNLNGHFSKAVTGNLTMDLPKIAEAPSAYVRLILTEDCHRLW